VAGHPALGGWGVVNEPEGMLKTGTKCQDACLDTQGLQGSGAGWAGAKYDYSQLLGFINRQTAAIKAADSGALVSVGVWNARSNTGAFGLTDHYADLCLIKAGGQTRGTLDFHQFHSYSWQGKFDDYAPFNKSETDYKTTKPIVVGEFWEQAGGGMKITDMFGYVYNHGYAGAWSWDLMNHGDNQRLGVKEIRNNTSNGRIPIHM